MADFYDDMAAMASGLLASTAAGGLGQGTVKLRRITVTPPENDWEEGEEKTEEWTLKAVSRRQNQKFDKGTLIETVGDVIACAVFGTKPRLTDILVIDGVNKSIADIKPIPSAGTVAAWQFFVEV